MIKIYSNYDLFNEKSEVIILFGLLDKLTNIELDNNHNNISKFNGVIEYCKKNFIYCDKVEDCDIIVYPGFDIVNNDFIKLRELANVNKKKLLCFYNNDDDTQYKLDENIILFRTSFYNGTKLFNEYALSVWGPDYFNNSFIDGENISIGYCGHSKYGRKKYINWFQNQKEFKTNFIVNEQVWTKLNNKHYQNNYFNNLRDNMFIFCNRGAGNYSYRFYEIFMMGRIPILIDSDCVYPFEEKYNLKNHCVFIKEKNIKKMYQINMHIRKFIIKNKNNLISIQKSNRALWEKYFSPCGFMDNLKEIILQN